MVNIDYTGYQSTHTHTPHTHTAECPNIRINPHVVASGGGVTVGSVIKFSCDPGYVVNGAQSITCLANGEWTSTAPVCAYTGITSPTSKTTGTTPSGVTTGGQVGTTGTTPSGVTTGGQVGTTGGQVGKTGCTSTCLMFLNPCCEYNMLMYCNAAVLCM